MSACWPLQMPIVPKAVLISLADNANDAGVCWPSITTICERTCASRRAVIDAITWLEKSGVLIAKKESGRSTNYEVCPEKFSADFSEKGIVEVTRTRAGGAPLPVQEAHQCATSTSAGGAQTGAPRAPLPVQEAHLPVQEAHPNRKEPSYEPSGNRKKDSRAQSPEKTPPKAGLKISDLTAIGASEQVASDFLSTRKTKFTATALAGFEREAAKAGISLAAALQIATERGWQGFKADWVQKSQSGQSLTSSTLDHNRASAAEALRRAEERDRQNATQ